MNIRAKLATVSGSIVTGGYLLLASAHALAADVPSAINPATAPDVTNADGKAIFSNLAGSAIGIIELIAGILAVLFLIWNGIQYIMSNGDPEKAKKARAGIINAVIGIIIIVAAYYIIFFAIGLGNNVTTSTDTTSMLMLTKLIG